MAAKRSNYEISMAAHDRQLLTPSQANATHHKNQYVHKRSRDDNESAICGAHEGATSLEHSDVNCADCLRSCLHCDGSGWTLEGWNKQQARHDGSDFDGDCRKCGGTGAAQ